MRTTRRGRPKTKRRAPTIPGIEFSRRHYEFDKNPVHVWRTIHLCNLFGRPLPSWALEYLAPIAATFFAWTTRWKDGGVPVPRDLDAAIAKALGMRQRGAGNVFRTYNETKGLDLALAVLGELDNNVKLYMAWEHVANSWGVDVSTVRRAWHRYKHLFEVLDTTPSPKPHDK